MELYRPKSAPPADWGRMLSGRESPSDDQESTKRRKSRSGDTLEDRMNKFHTTERMIQRLKFRRRTEAEIVVNETPSGLLEMETPSRRMSQIELENVVARVCRPTASYSARISSAKRINAKDIYVPPKAVQIEYYSIENDRFKGNRCLTNKALTSLVTRLSHYDTERRPPDSKRSQTPEVRKRLGSLASYRWQGLKNC